MTTKHTLIALVRKPLTIAGLAVMMALMPPLTARAVEGVTLWNIASVRTGNALFSISSSIAASISLPFNTRNPCSAEHCGVRSLVALAHIHPGIIDLLRQVSLGQMDSAILPLDIVYAAYNGQLRSLQYFPYRSLRLLAPVTSLPVHIVTLQDSEIQRIEDLTDQIIAFVPDADQTAATHFNRILNAYGIDPEGLEYRFLSSQHANQALIDNEVQVLVMTGQDPIAEIRDLDREYDIQIIPIDFDKVQQILSDWPFFYTSQLILAHSYENQTANSLTLGTSYVWVTHKDADENFVHDMVRALWHPQTKRILRTLNQHAAMPENLQQEFLLIKDLQYHQGALRFYQENGLLDNS